MIVGDGVTVSCCMAGHTVSDDRVSHTTDHCSHELRQAEWRRDATIGDLSTVVSTGDCGAGWALLHWWQHSDQPPSVSVLCPVVVTWPVSWHQTLVHSSGPWSQHTMMLHQHWPHISLTQVNTLSHLTSHSLSVKLYILLLSRQQDPDTLFPLFTFTLNFHLTESIISSSCFYESTLKILKYHVQMQLFLENTWRRQWCDTEMSLGSATLHWSPSPALTLRSSVAEQCHPLRCWDQRKYNFEQLLKSTAEKKS